MCTVGILSWLYPTKLPRWVVSRDLLFLIGALILWGLIVADGFIYLYESIILIAFYIFYVTLVVVESKPNYLNRLIGGPQLENNPQPAIANSPKGMGAIAFLGNTVSDPNEEDDYDIDYFELHRHYVDSHNLHRLPSPISAHSRQHASNYGSTAHHPEDVLDYNGEFYRDEGYSLKEYEILVHLFPIIFIWPELTAIEAILEIIKAPLVFIFNLTVPVIHERHLLPKNEYSSIQLSSEIVLETEQEEICVYPRFLLLAQLFLCPLTVCGCLKILSNEVLGIKVWIIDIFIGIIFSAIGFVLTKKDPVTKYAKFLTFFGFTESVFYIIVLSGELVNLIEAIGFIFELRSSILGLTLFAVGNSFGGYKLVDIELVTDISLAKTGSRTLAMSACYGAPMLSNLHFK
jgi:Ca2+/Na+ antiporter